MLASSSLASAGSNQATCSHLERRHQPHIAVGRCAGRSNHAQRGSGVMGRPVKLGQRMPAEMALTVRAIPLLGVDTATVVSLLKGPTLSELVVYGQAALSLAGSAWQAVTSPFAIFGTDRWGLNLLFYFAVLLMGFNLIVQAPKQ